MFSVGKNVYGNSCYVLNKTRVYDWLSHFKDGEMSIEDQSCSERLLTSITLFVVKPMINLWVIRNVMEFRSEDFIWRLAHEKLCNRTCPAPSYWRANRTMNNSKKKMNRSSMRRTLKQSMRSNIKTIPISFFVAEMLCTQNLFPKPKLSNQFPLGGFDNVEGESPKDKGTRNWLFRHDNASACVQSLTKNGITTIVHLRYLVLVSITQET